MSQTVFETIPDSKKRALYTRMWGSEGFSGAFPTVKTWYRGAGSENSYTFSGIYDKNHAVKKKTCRERLADLFGIDIQHRELFREKFRQSCSGSGQESRRIATLHSSSLCALLFFYRLSPEKSHEMEMEIEGKAYVFNDSRFEYQNTVIEGGNPSNIDVVLIGWEKADKTRQVVLFLESKFAEYYLYTGGKLEVAKAYLNGEQCPYGKAVYENLPPKLGIRTETQEGSDTFLLRSDTSCYLGGIKQMISHYIGVRNLCDAPERKDSKDEVAKAILGGAKVLLGEILFTDGIGRFPIGKGEECLASYREKYGVLADLLNEQLRNDGGSGTFTVLRELLSYTQFKDSACVSEPKIKKFYFESGT